MGELIMCSRREAVERPIVGSVMVAEIGEKIPSDLPANEILVSRQNSGDKDDETSLSFKDEVIPKSLTVQIVLNKPAGYVSRQTEQPYDW
jgi:16S rRNA U516 pseudouridylate synthase RsuA-like enzyme